MGIQINKKSRNRGGWVGFGSNILPAHNFWSEPDQNFLGFYGLGFKVSNP